MRDRPEQSVRGAAVVGVLYAVITFFMLLQQPGSTTYDTRAELTQRPGDFLSGAFTLWHPESNFGEFQNQAYGYLFPQGTWFVLTDLLGMPDWISQRLWSALILIIACEGARRVARAIGMADLPAMLAGAVFAFSPRLLGTVSVQTAESLPGAVMPWLVLPVVLHLRGRLGPWSTALLSGAAVVCMGGVNAVETAACLPLAVILVLWGARHGLTDRRFVVGWFAAVGAACLWWALPLLVLARYTPPFYEYVESAGDTTSLIGWSEAARGDSSWLGYLLSGDQPWWPAMYQLTTEPVLIVVAAVVAGIGLAGLTQVPGDIKRPLMFAAVLGLTCITVAHGGVAGAPSAEFVRSLLDGALQIFRNVHKIDPLVRLPLALGFGCAVAWAVERLLTWRPQLDSGRDLLLLSPLLLVLVLGQPYLANDTRTPGWDSIATPWEQARDYLEAADAADEPGPASRALIVPGSSFAQQDWGWTIDEPLVILGGTSTVTRSQIPLIPGESIRYLSALDQMIATGRATEALVDQLARVDIRYVVLRRDLLRNNTRSPHPGGTAVSLARAGLERVAGFGSAGGGEAAVEIFEVPRRLPAVRAAALDDVATVRGAPESVLGLQSAGLVDPTRPTVLEGEPGWKAPADVVTDTNQRRERAFGNNDEGISALMTQDEPWRLARATHDFPAGPGRDQVVAKYSGLTSVTASTAQGYADNYGPVTLQSAPYAAIDGNLDTQWVSSIVGAADEQWFRLRFDGERAIREVTVTPVADDPRVVPIRTIEVVAGDQRVRAKVTPSGAPVIVALDGSRVDGVEIRVVEAATDARSARVGLREVSVSGLVPRRTALLPGVAPFGAPLQFSVTPGRRACNIALAAPDCDVARVRTAEEEGGLDRTFATEDDQQVRFSGHVVARGTPEAARLLDPIEQQTVTATSSYGQDPKVAGRFAYDGQPTTAWESDNTDLYPTLVFEWPEPRTITGLTVRSGGTSDAPVAALVDGGDGERRVPLVNDDAVAIEPVRTRTLRVRFEKAPGAAHVVVPEIELTGADVTRPFFAETPTGAVCGFGPPLRIDGRVVPTRVTGTMADVVNGSPLAFEACKVDDVNGDSPALDLAGGDHHLVATPNAEFELLDLAVLPTQADSASAASRTVRIERWGSSQRTLSVAGGPASLLYLPENFNPGWRAEVDGKALTAVRVDGWQQGWVLPAGEETSVQLRYTPERTYDVVLPVGLAVSGLVLIGGIVSLLLLLFGRRGRAVVEEPRVWPVTGPPGRAGAIAAVVVTLLLLGPVAAAGLLLAILASRRGRGTPIVVGAVALIATSGALDALSVSRPVAGAAELFAALAVGALAGVVLGAPERPGRRRQVAS
ncbi:alpha-(1-_3)-arabinofuranosyltransferase family protein [Nocardioides sp. WS12]|uniref:alpha-(1->3)-arabinofuranosyltransferase domain-containing protein n=1 Tax=Nocardioides sp. WS12 TaxID=2486272 RepID=UPI0015FA42DE|nr:alpha-(1->3)-arabinofuranosyltransferase family protein [Nocardioides sp. WS12]